MCRTCPLKTLNDLRDRRLAYDMMAKLAVAAAEEHVGRPARDAGLVAVYAQVQRSYSHNITCQACSALSACRRKGHAQLHEAWTSCFVQAGMFVCRSHPCTRTHVYPQIV